MQHPYGFLKNALTLALVAAAGCNLARSLPPLPQLDTSSFPREVRSAIDEALAAVRAEQRSPAKALHLAMVLHAHNQLRAAVQCYQRAHLLDQNAFAPLYLWGQALASDGENGPAVNRLKQALAIRPDSIPARLKLADTLYASGDSAGAAEIAKQVLGRDPDNPQALYTMARASDPQAAIEPLRRVLARFPRYGAAQFALAAAYRRTGQEQLAQDVLKDYELNKKIVPPVDDPEMQEMMHLQVGATGLLRRAREHESAGRLPDALALHERAIELEPGLVDAWVNLISLYGRLDRRNDAGKAFRRAIELDAGRAEAYYNFGVLALQEQNFEQARSAFQKAVDLAPRYPEALLNLGVVLERDRRLKEAASLFERAIDVKPAFPLAHFHLGRIYANQRRFDLAIAAFEKSLNPPGDSTPAYVYALGATHALAGHRQKAIEVLRDAHRQATERGQAGIAQSIARDLDRLQ